MKRFSLIILSVVALSALHIITAWAITGDTLDTFKVNATSTITPRVSTNVFQLPYLATSTASLCLTTDASGTLKLVACGSGGSGSTTNVFGVSPIVVTQSGANATASCPTCVVTTTGNWQGTWQLFLPSDFLSSSTNLAPSTTIPTTYVSTFNGQSGAVTYSSAATTTANGATGPALTLATSGPLWSDITGSGGTVTFKSISTGTLAGSGYLNLSQYLTSAVTALQGLNGALSIASSGPLISNVTGSGNTVTITSISTSTLGGAGYLNLAQYLTTAVTSLQALTGALTFASSGPLIADITGSGNTLTIKSISTSTLAGAGYLNLGQYATSTGIASYNVYSTSTGITISTTTTSADISLSSSSLGVIAPIPTSTLNTLYLQIANNLSDVNSSSTARTNLGLKATSSLPVADANGIQTSYIGSACAGGQFVQSVSATGTVICATAAGSGNGNVIVNAVNSVANELPYWTTTASSTLSPTSSLTYTPPANATASAVLSLGQASSTACELFWDASDSVELYQYFLLPYGTVLSQASTSFCHL